MEQCPLSFASSTLFKSRSSPPEPRSGVAFDASLSDMAQLLARSVVESTARAGPREATSSRTLSSGTFRSISRGTRSCLLVEASGKDIFVGPRGISRTFLGSAGRNALVAADPFHPSSTLLLNKSSGGTNGPLAAAATVMEAEWPPGTEEKRNELTIVEPEDVIVTNSPHLPSSALRPSFKSNVIFAPVSNASAAEEQEAPAPVESQSPASSGCMLADLGPANSACF
ncbi:hypothetical protein CDL12_27175 [Handroanthus impetiginosus]|uniref:Uncharacterized protein n=1 Tax=Handroanthus impetiginosus TaxID=429701 RepID=A0A2G9G4S9_9LAMI|nr:hypothetical protein CDL12_27175 [Handroanthus impetiginosus]